MVAKEHDGHNGTSFISHYKPTHESNYKITQQKNSLMWKLLKQMMGNH